MVCHLAPAVSERIQGHGGAPDADLHHALTVQEPLVHAAAEGRPVVELLSEGRVSRVHVSVHVQQPHGAMPADNGQLRGQASFWGLSTAPSRLPTLPHLAFLSHGRPGINDQPCSWFLSLNHLAAQNNQLREVRQKTDTYTASAATNYLPITQNVLHLEPQRPRRIRMKDGGSGELGRAPQSHPFSNLGTKKQLQPNPLSIISNSPASHRKATYNLNQCQASRASRKDLHPPTTDEDATHVSFPCMNSGAVPLWPFCLFFKLINPS